MRTPHGRVLASVLLDTKGNLRFVRTGSREEGARVAMTPMGEVLHERHWVITLEWDAERLAIAVVGDSAH
jgi:hypothetical protein